MLCVDERPSIQALERAQGYLKLPNGRALTGQSHDYKRHGTTTLFAALEVARPVAAGKCERVGAGADAVPGHRLGEREQPKSLKSRGGIELAGPYRGGSAAGELTAKLTAVPLLV